MRGQSDLRVAVVAAVLCAILAVALPWEVARLVAALPLALLLPGYAIAAATFGKRPIGGAQQLMLSLAGSIAVLALGGVLLNYLPGGLRTLSWAILLVVVVLAASRGAALRRQAAAGGELRPTGPRPRAVDVACGGLALAVVVAALILAYTPLSAGGAQGYTALWMLPAEGSGTVRVGVASSEHDAKDYLLEVRAEGSPKTYRFRLDPGSERVFAPQLQLPAAGTTQVVASLYQQDHPGQVYRRVTSWLPASKP